MKEMFNVFLTTVTRTSSDGTNDVVTSKLNESDWMAKKLPTSDDGDDEVGVRNRL